jgi:hypothetical protein
LYQLAISPIMEEFSFFSTSPPASTVTWIFDLSHSDWCEVESQGCFDLLTSTTQSCVSSCLCSRGWPSQPSMRGEALGLSKIMFQ